MANSKYPTIGGVVTRGEAYTKLLYHMREAQELCAVMAHLHNTESNQMDSLLAKGWLGMEQLVKRMCDQLTNLAMKKLQ